ncbi:WG repeat-containing protein [Gymnodinialimonas sp. 2305UL16-5]|uniref:WG repeat-containing protein n=1 Tax=Gymnodinialimonas mytili TaxID=3126503 RepID=UPI0030A7A1D3
MIFASKLLAIIAFFAGALAAHAEEQAEDFRVSCGGVFGLCGYLASDGEVMVPQRFESLRRFSDQLAPARMAGLWGYLNPDGTFAIDPIFDQVGDFHGGRAEVILEGNAGVIDASGGFVVPADFWRAIPLGQDAALVILPEDATSHRRRLDLGSLFEEFHLFNIDNGLVTESPIEFDWFVRPGDIGPSDRIWASLDGNTFGLLNDKGNWLVEPQFSHVQSLHEDRAIVVSTGTSGERLWGAVDGDGTIVIELEHHWLSYFSNGYGLVGGPRSYDQRRTGLIHPDGTVVGNRLFEEVRRPTASSPARVMEDGIWYNFTNDGTLVREEPDGTVIGSCPQGLTIAREAAGYAITNQAGERQIHEYFDHISFGIVENDTINSGSIHRREIDCSGPILVGHGPLAESEWTYIRTDGTPVIPGSWFTSSYRFNAGYAVVQTGSDADGSEMWGVLNELGEFTLPLGPAQIRRRPEMILPSGQPYFLLGTGTDEYPSDAYGLPVTLPDAIDDNRREQAVQCSGGARIVGDNNGFGIEGPDGTTLVPSVHRAISCYRNGVAWAPNENSEQWCPIGPDGAFRSEPACIDSYYPYSITHHYPERFSDSPFESNIRWVSAWLDWGMDRRNEPPIWVRDGVISQGSYSIIPFGRP